MKHGDLIVALGICMGMSACASQYVKHELGAKKAMLPPITNIA